MTVFSHCQMCQQKLEHTALFCPKCGQSACSWECYVHHVSGHSRETNGTQDGRHSHGLSHTHGTAVADRVSEV